ncbi:MAG: integrase family protein [Pseudonocardiales bacterium]|nr:integrase family protein [Pseudonocardiales bacterium]
MPSEVCSPAHRYRRVHLVHAQGCFGPFAAGVCPGRAAARLADFPPCRGRPLATIASYLSIGEALVAYLIANGRPTGAGVIARGHIGKYLTDMRDRSLSQATVVRHYRSCPEQDSQLSDRGRASKRLPRFERITAYRGWCS